MNTRILSLSVGVSLLMAPDVLKAQNVQRPDPGNAPDFIPPPPPNLAEVTPFPSNTDQEIALLAHLYDPKRDGLILSVDSQSNRPFVVQASHDLVMWQDAGEPILGNKSIITFFVSLDNTSEPVFYRIVKR